MTHYMLDTNTVSHLVKKHPKVAQHVSAASNATLSISAITAGEIHYGLKKRPEASHLQRVMEDFFKRIAVLPWDGSVAEIYGVLRETLTKKGKLIAPLDLLIASHALATDAILVTNDKAFKQVKGLKLADWTR